MKYLKNVFWFITGFMLAMLILPAFANACDVYCHPDYGCEVTSNNTVIVNPAPVNVTVNPTIQPAQPTPVINNITTPRSPDPAPVTVNNQLTNEQSGSNSQVVKNPDSVDIVYTVRGARPLLNPISPTFTPLPETYREDGGTFPKHEPVPYYGPINPGSFFVPVSEMLMYCGEIDVQSAKDLLGKDSPLWEPEFDKPLTVTRVRLVTTPMQEWTRRGHTIRQSTKGCTSWDLLHHMILRCALNGFDVLHLTAQGVERTLRTKGIGTSAGSGGSMLSPGESAGFTGSVLGSIVGGKAYKVDEPWLRGIMLSTKGATP